MKRLPYPTAKALLASGAAVLSLGLLFSPESRATDYVFTGTGDWYTAGTNPNWNPTVTNGLLNNTLDTAGNTATINGAVNYNAGPAGGDFLLGHGDTMTIDGIGASWTQAVDVGNWVKVGGSGGTGTVVIQNGGTFNENNTGARLRLGQDGGTGVVTVTSTGGGINIAGLTEISAASVLNLQGGTNSFGGISMDGTLNVSGGTTTLSGAINTSSTASITLSGGTVNNTGTGNVFLGPSVTFTLSGNAHYNQTGTGEFQPGATIGGTAVQSISGGASLDITGLVSFQGGNTQKFDINGGALTLRTSAYDGIYSNGGYFNFTTGSTGVMTFTNDGSAETNIFESQIRYNDTAYDASNYTDVFDVEHPTANTTTISLIGAVPEPSTWLGGALLLGLAGWMRRGAVRRLFGTSS